MDGFTDVDTTWQWGPLVGLFFISLLFLSFFSSLSSLLTVAAPHRRRRPAVGAPCCLLAVGRSSNPRPQRARSYPLPSTPFLSQTPSLLRPPARVEQSNLPATCRPSRRKSSRLEASPLSSISVSFFIHSPSSSCFELSLSRARAVRRRSPRRPNLATPPRFAAPQAAQPRPSPPPPINELD